MENEEIWREVDGFPGYEVSNHGNVRSFRMYKKGRILSPAIGTGGLLHVILYRMGVKYTRQVHVLVLEAFIGSKPKGMECCHNDGNPENNDASNLRWDTHANNLRDRKRHGTDNSGTRNGMHKLTKPQVLEIARLLKDGKRTQISIATEFNVSRRTIGFIGSGHRWGWLTSQHPEKWS